MTSSERQPEVVIRPAADCQQVDCERQGCEKTVDATGCETCSCVDSATTADDVIEEPTTVCPEVVCSSTCDAESGYTTDERGCRQCACAEAATSSPASDDAEKMRLSCDPVDCATRCPVEFRTEVGPSGCEMCVCVGSDVIKPEDVRQVDESSYATTWCECSAEACAQETSCTSCNCERFRPPRDRETATSETSALLTSSEEPEVDPMPTDDDETTTPSDVTEHPEADNEADAVPSPSAMTQEEAVKPEMEMCEHQLTCHPICTAIKDERGCDVECSCNDVFGFGETVTEDHQLPAPSDEGSQSSEHQAAEPEIVCLEETGCRCSEEAGQRRAGASTRTGVASAHAWPLP